MGGGIIVVPGSSKWEDVASTEFSLVLQVFLLYVWFVSPAQVLMENFNIRFRRH